MLGLLVILEAIGGAKPPPTAAVVLDWGTISIVSGSKLLFPVKEGEHEAFGVCLVGNTSSCPEGEHAFFDPGRSRCALQTPGCECWQWVASAEWGEPGDGAGVSISRSDERPDCLVVRVEGRGEHVSRTMAVKNRLLHNGKRFLTRGGRLALESMHREIWGDGANCGDALPVTRSQFVSRHAREWCDRESSNMSAFPCEGSDVFTLRIDSFPPAGDENARTLFYYGWPLGTVFGMVAIVFFADRVY